MKASRWADNYDPDPDFGAKDTIGGANGNHMNTILRGDCLK